MVAKLSLADGNLKISGNSILTDVPEDVVLTPAECGQGAFLGVNSDRRGSRVVFPIGKLKGLRILCLYRFKLWWMTQSMGKSGQDIPSETQFLMVEIPEEDSQHPKLVYYTVLLPILEGGFRAVLQGNSDDELELCLESGDPSVQEFEGRRLVYVGAGLDPYNVISNSIKYLEDHLQTFRHRDNKEMPDMLNWFGWCTWDAFYTNVSPNGIKEGLKSLIEGGTPPKFVIIDDGWQSVAMDSTCTESRINQSANFADRLTDIKENKKFQARPGFRQTVSEIKDRFTLKYVYIWHAMVGYWAGVQPGIAETARYDPKIVPVIPSPGVESNGIGFVLGSLLKSKVGLVNPERIHDFYNDLHSYVASIGIDGVKVDNQSVIETLGAGFGGRVELAKRYHEALEESVSRNFRNNAIISCMSHSMDALYCAKKAGVVRASDDFFPRDPASHTVHIASVAYNSIFLGEFMQPDWDMFHSLHPMADYHGAARAIGGCPIYVSDKPGNHDFKVLKKLVLPDGSTLRARLPGRPTIDCLFSDPTKDGKSLLKVWNMNDYTGVVGVFNCQGASWCRATLGFKIHDTHPGMISGTVQTTDVPYLHSIVENGWNGDCVMYSHKGGTVNYVTEDVAVTLQLEAREYELLTVVPVRRLSNGAKFAPIGLVKMFNSGGAIAQVRYESERSGCIDLRVRGCGTMGAYASVRPSRVAIDGKDLEFGYEEKSGLITLRLVAPQEELHHWNLTFEL